MKPKSGDCHFFSWEEKNWEEIGPGGVQVGDWLFYLSDMYFGRVQGITQEAIQITITNFRVRDAKYTLELKSSKWQQLRQKPTNVLVDPEIEGSCSKIHRALEKAFSIWKKLDTLVLEAKQIHPFAECVPTPFLEMGKSFGKWAASGYMWQSELEKLRENEFIRRIGEWRSFGEISEDENFPEDLLEICDYISSLSIQNCKGKGVAVADYLMIRAGYFIDSIKNRERFFELPL